MRTAFFVGGAVIGLGLALVIKKVKQTNEPNS